MTPQEQFAADVTRPGQSAAMTEFLSIVASLPDDQFWKLMGWIVVSENQRTKSAA